MLTKRPNHQRVTPVPVQIEPLESRRLLNAGGLDSSFGRAGEVIGPSLSPATRIAVQSDGKILVAATNSDVFSITRFNYDGSIDTSFGNNGSVTTQVGSSDTIGGIAVDSRGRIVIVGTVTGVDPNSDFAVLRYTAGGGLDKHFNGSGIITTSFGGDDAANAVAISPSDTIYVAGSKLQDNGTRDFALARYAVSGHLDASFGFGGEVLTDLGADDVASAITISGGQVVAAGTSSGFGSAFAVARYDGAGQLDTSFNGTGFKVLQLGSVDTGAAVTIQSDQKIVVGGTVDGVGTLFRFTSAGLPDSTYGANGVANFVNNGTNDPANVTGVNDLTLESDGKVLAAGFFTNNNTTTFALARFTTAGNLDTTFGTMIPALSNPLVITQFPDNSGATSVALSPDGKIVAAGGATGLDLARYNNNATGTDVTPPTAALSPVSRLRRATSRGVTITVTYTDNVAVNLSTIGSTDLLVTGPNSFSKKATFLSATPGKNAATITATYSVAAPAGGFTSSANGVYTVSLRRQEVRDTNGNTAAAGVLGSFTVKIA